MDKNNTNPTLSELLKVINEESFTRIVNTIDLDKYVKKLTAYKFLQLLIVGQINQVESLTSLSKYVKDEDELHKHIEFDAISTVQLSRKQNNLSPQIFEKIFLKLVREIQIRMKQTPFVRDIGRLHVIDSTTMSLSQYPWATFRKTKAGVRVHMRVVVTKDLVVPDKAVLLPATHADRMQMNELIDIEPDALYLFDRGYVDYKQFDKYCHDKVRFISRLKKNAKFEILSEQEPDPENLIFRDAEVFLGNEQNGTKMQNTMRIIDIADQEKNHVTIVTSCFDLKSQGDWRPLSLSLENRDVFQMDETAFKT